MPDKGQILSQFLQQLNAHSRANGGESGLDQIWTDDFCGPQHDLRIAGQHGTSLGEHQAGNIGGKLNLMKVEVIFHPAKHIAIVEIDNSQGALNPLFVSYF